MTLLKPFGAILLFFFCTVVYAQVELPLDNLELSGDEPCEELNFLNEEYYNKGDILQAIKVAEQAMKVCNESNGVHYAYALNNMGLSYKLLGQYEKALPLYIKALEVLEKYSYEDSVRVFNLVTMNNIATLYASLGLADEALSYAQETVRKYQFLQIKEKNIRYGMFQNTLASIFSIKKQYEKSLDHYKKAQNFLTERGLENSIYYGAFLSNMVHTYVDADQLDTALTTVVEALKLIKDTAGENHLYYGIASNNLGSIYLRQGEFEKAEKAFRETLRCIEHSVGKNYIDYEKVPFNLANTLKGKGDPYSAQSYFEEALVLCDSQINRSFGILGEYNREKFIDHIRMRFDGYASFAVEEHERIPRARELLYDNALHLKGLLLDQSKKVFHSLKGDSSLLQKHQEWLEARQYLSYFYAAPTRPDSSKLAALEAKVRKLEGEMIQSSPVFAQARKRVSWKDVRDSLGETEAAVEFLHFNFYRGNTSDSVLYCALVLRKDFERPRLVYLFEEQEMEDWLSYQPTSPVDYIEEIYRGEKRAPVRPDYSRLYEMTWEPLDSLLRGVQKVYYSPSGLLHRLSFPAIPVNSGLFLSDKYRLQYVESSRELAVETREEPEISDGILYGGVAFGADSLDLAQGVSGSSEKILTWHRGNQELLGAGSWAMRSEIQAAYLPVKPPLVSPLAGRRERPFRSGNRGESLSSLPATKEEVLELERVYQSKGIRCLKLTGTEATEESFRLFGASVPSPPTLHLATHGFFFPDEDKPAGSLKQGFKYSDNPLFRSGIALAGADNAWKGNPPWEGMEDGILTAYEISNLDLSNTQLVVLSACETALGDIRGSEGVYGMQRAFKIAGAGHLLMTLWEIPDNRQVVEFMSAFYTYWFEKGDIHEAFYRTQEDMKKKYEPYVWGAFVLI
ncbi:MAG: CHAT domain-containing protein [Phaeodactylibacter sp.]|nr:CHAT domain-containing protein [Phaeodactylibacter sp.]